LDFADEEDPSIAYVDGPEAARYFDRAEDRAEYEYVWKILLDKSIPLKEWE
jgi:hypothetical protein